MARGAARYTTARRNPGGGTELEYRYRSPCLTPRPGSECATVAALMRVDLANLATMTRMDIDELRMRYEAAFEAYRLHTAKLLERSKGGQQPTPQELAAETDALYELTRLRRELLDALAGSLQRGR